MASEMASAGIAVESERIRKTPRRRLSYRVDRVDLYKFPQGVLQRYLVVRSSTRARALALLRSARRPQLSRPYPTTPVLIAAQDSGIQEEGDNEPWISQLWADWEKPESRHLRMPGAPTPLPAGAVLCRCVLPAACSLTARTLSLSSSEYVCDLGAGKIDDFKAVTKVAKLTSNALRYALPPLRVCCPM